MISISLASFVLFQPWLASIPFLSARVLLLCFPSHHLGPALKPGSQHAGNSRPSSGLLCLTGLDNASEVMDSVAPAPSREMTALRKAVSARGERIAAETLAHSEFINTGIGLSYFMSSWAVGTRSCVLAVKCGCTSL